jgi:stage V sporulation protein AD
MGSVQRVGDATYRIQGAYVAATSAVVGPKEGRGPYQGHFDRVWESESAGHASFEKAEQALLTDAYDIVLKKRGITWADVGLVIGGDLLDQLISTNFSARAHQRPLLGLFSACAVFTEGLAVAAWLTAAEMAPRVLVSAVSHHYAAERQFRYPVELGYQRTPTASWTATAAGAALVENQPAPIAIDAVTIGRVIDFGGQDPNDMGSAMAPAAFDTIVRHLNATRQQPGDFDAIFTGDLGKLGLDILRRYADQQGVTFASELDDCGYRLYHLDDQDIHNGGSGPGCSASVFAGPLARALTDGRLPHVLFVATGALFSPTSYRQGESIPAVAHAVELRGSRSAAPSRETPQHRGR